MTAGFPPWLDRLCLTLTLRRRFELSSPLSPEEARHRLTTSLRFEPTMHGRVRNGGLWVRRRRGFMRPYLEPYIFGRLLAEGKRTRIHCTVGPGYAITVGIALWIAVVIAFVSADLYQQIVRESDLWFDILLIPIVMLVLPLALLITDGRRADDEAMVIDYLRKTLQIS